MTFGLSKFGQWSKWPVLLVSGLLLFSGTGSSQEALPRLAEVGPWPVVSQLVGYRGRLWLANSVKGRNHNSADLYSLDPRSGDLRYERHLFSQDAGRPLVADGLLYWPFEDGRVSLGWGDFLVTDGERWRLGVIDTSEIFHVHAMAEVDGRLVAATSAWRAGLQVSGDGGNSWRRLYGHPTPERRVSRITELIEVNGRALAYLTLRDRRRVLVLDGDEVAELRGWPKEALLRGWARHGDWVYALVQVEDGTAVWRSDGVAVEQVAPARAGWRPRSLAAGGDALWTVSAEGESGMVWRSKDGRTWERFQAILGGRPHDVAVYSGGLFVGGEGADGQGTLWGMRLGSPVASEQAESSGSPGRGWTIYPPLPKATSWRMELALADPLSYRDYGAVLRDLVFNLVRSGAPSDFWSPFLTRNWPGASQPHFSDGSPVTAGMLGRWTLLWGMSLSRAGELTFEDLRALTAGRIHLTESRRATTLVPLEWLNEAWTTPANPAEKYYATAPAAIWTAGEIGQDDAATLGALIARLGREDDPLWLTGDVVGALMALTGERFAYDRDAWRAWWEEARAQWPR